MNGARLLLSLFVVSFPSLVLSVVRTTSRSRAWALVNAICLGAGFVLLEASLVHASLPLVFTLLGQQELAAACKAMGGHLFGAGPPFGAFAGFLAILIALRAGAGVMKAVRTQAVLRDSAALATVVPVGGHRTALLALPGQSALAIPGGTPLVLLSVDLLPTLRPSELNAVVRHEAAHLRHHHVRFLLLGRAVASGLWFLPWMRRCRDTLRLGLERWADDDASQGSGQARSDVRSALAKLTGLGPSRWADDRIRALDGGQIIDRPSWGWPTAVSALVPLALGLGITLVVHLAELLQVAGSAVP